MGASAVAVDVGNWGVCVGGWDVAVAMTVAVDIGTCVSKVVGCAVFTAGVDVTIAAGVAQATREREKIVESKMIFARIDVGRMLPPNMIE
jgi:hypothetical protein